MSRNPPIQGRDRLGRLFQQPANAGPGDIVIGSETDCGPWVSALVAAGYRVPPAGVTLALAEAERRTPLDARHISGPAVRPADR